MDISPCCINTLQNIANAGTLPGTLYFSQAVRSAVGRAVELYGWKKTRDLECAEVKSALRHGARVVMPIYQFRGVNNGNPSESTT
jgi:hypothetical protein